MSINVCGCTNYKDRSNEDIEEEPTNSRNSIHPLKVCSEMIKERHVNPLSTEKDGQQHYSNIRKFSRLLRSQVSQHHGRYYFCYACLHGFTTEQYIDVHKRLCQAFEAQREDFPYSDPIQKIANVKKQLKAPFVGYADFECILKS